MDTLELPGYHTKVDIRLNSEAQYDSPKKAKRCEARGFQPKFSVGDIVFCGGDRFGWFYGGKAWVVDSSRAALAEKKLRFYYVITSIDQDDNQPELHRPRYHLFTLAMTGKKGHECGWTFDVWHQTPVLVKKPPRAVVKESKPLLGKKADHLL